MSTAIQKNMNTIQKLMRILWLKKNFTAYMYKLNGKDLDSVHAREHAPQSCKHRSLLQYTDGLKRLDANYFENLKEDNGDCVI